MIGFDSFTAGRQFINHRNIEVAVNGHGQGTRNGRCGHHKHMGRDLALIPEFGTLCHAKTVLLINNHKPQVAELNGIFNKGMGADNDMKVSRLKHGMDLLAACFFSAACKQINGYIHSIQKPPDGSVMLVGQNFGRGHEAGLETIVERDKHTHERYQRFPATYIALQQAVHLFARSEIEADFAYNFLLCIGQLKRQMLFIKCVEPLPYLPEDIPAYFLIPV